ncbi:MAG: MBL fold metallo-hydrolase [Phascolarctobacterium sp.]|nr:MBL fold metallo-hydrolase [Phascolarctobacterium sp.]
MLSIKFHKNPERIGGGITEIIFNEHRLIIDLGAELEYEGVEPNPNIDGVTIGKEQCDGVLITHYHGDHIGLLKYLLPEVPVYMSKVSQEIGLTIYDRLKRAKLLASDDKTIDRLENAKLFSYEDFGKDFQIGAFTVRPIRVDHSAFDALAYLITVAGKKIFFTGDFRSHGYTGKALYTTLEKYVGKVDVIITEGTMLSREDETISEKELREKAIDICNEHRYILYLGSSTNIDSLLSMSSAAKLTKKAFCADNFQKEIFKIVAENSKSDFYKNPIHQVKYPQGLVIALRMSQLDFAEAFYKKYGQESVLIYSLWDGYITKKQELQKLQTLWGNRFIQLHSGGHASADDIKKMVEICSKEREQTMVIPMHLENFDFFSKLKLPATVRNLQQSEELLLVP